MDLNRWQKIEDIFQAALDLTPAERPDFINEQSGGDEDLQREVEKLIARYEQEEEFLESPVWTDSQVLGTTLKNRVASSLEEEIQPTSFGNNFIGERIGAYRITEQIGKGGMGIVYAAERADGEFHQKVAAKLIKRGMDTDFIVRRFRRERQVLANLNHPNIAHLFDGGTTANGSPYFIMEFIEGKPFLEYCRKNELNLREKLELFLLVCRAVAYAHERKIVHRDIKPSNILVTAQGVPKLLDFGIAKILDSESIHESGVPTATAMRLMTPEYASPEQARGEAVTPASDQYSLGVLLYELLTGARPYKFSSRAPHEIARVICEEIPAEPSSGEFGKIITGEISDAALSDDFCQKLDRIVLKTLRKKPAERYASVNDLAADLERFLANEEVRAESFDRKDSSASTPQSAIEKSVEVSGNIDKSISPKSAALDNFQDQSPSEQVTVETISPRRKGIKQGFFITLVSILLIPIFLILTVTAIIRPPLITLLFLICFFGGIIRILYALFFESGKPFAPSAQVPAIVEAKPIERFNSSSQRAKPGVKANAENAKKDVRKETIDDEKSIAVLPFKIHEEVADNGDGKNNNSESGSEFLSIGLSDALITRLSKIRQFIVRPTSSILRFGINDADSFAAGRELKVRFVVEGNIVIHEKRIRVAMQLLDVEEHSIVWSGRFEENFVDVLELEDSISARVVESLLPTLTSEERKQMEKRGTENVEAYEAFLRGRFHFNLFNEESFKQAIFFYRKAVELDPNYAIAYAGIADYFMWLGIFGVLPPKETYQTAKQMAQRAIQLDADLAEAYAALGFAELCGDYNWESSEKNILRSIVINPHCAVAHNWLAILLYTARRFDEGIKHANKAIELDPLTYQNYRTLSWGFYFSRRFDESLKVITETIEKFPLTGTALANRSWLLRAMNRYEASLEDATKALETAGKSIFVQTGYAQALAAAGRLKDAENLIEKLEAHPDVKYVSMYQVALVYCYADQKEKALAALERAYEDRDGWLVWLNVEAALDPLRGDVRFEKLLRAVNPPNITAVSKNQARQQISGKDKKVVSRLASEFKSIAVLPFKILNSDAESETSEIAFLSIGLADAMITRLSNMRQFAVRPTSSILPYGLPDTDSFAAGAELGVNFLLDGTVIKIARQLRVSVQLLNVETKSIVWAERFDESLTDVLNLEDKIAIRVGESLVPHLTGDERARLAKRATENADAYEAFLRGRFYWNSFTEDSFAKAFAAYKEAIAKDENYALAYAGIADYYIWLGVYGIVAPQDCYPSAQEAARRAISIDPNLAEAYASLGFAQLCGDLDWENAEKNTVRAIEINPHYAVARLWYSFILQSSARFDEGIEQAKKAVEFDPLTYMNHHVLSWAYYFARRYDEAIRQGERTVKKFPSIGLGEFTLSWILRLLGKTEAALAASSKALKLSGDSLFVLLGHAQTLAAAGDKKQTEEVLQQIFVRGERQYLSYYQVALVYAYLGEKQRALDALEQAFADSEGWFIWLKVEPALDVLRGEERFQAILEKINFP